jgi:UrcA family protein
MYRFTIPMMIVALGFGFHSAHATPQQGPPSRVVQFADLDLSRAEGAAVLYHRLQNAAETVCAPLDDTEPVRHMEFRECVQKAISVAVAKVNRPALSAYYRALMSGHCPTIQVG